MSILRSSQFVRNVISDLRFGANFRIDRSSNLRCSLFRTSSRLLSSAVHQQNNDVQRAIDRLDRGVRRVGRISGQELLEVFRDIKSTGRATGTQSLFMIRCCGNLVPEETPEFRTRLVSEVWDTFEQLGVPLDISHYNALLSVYLENEFRFSATDFLSKLANKGIEPNRVTYQRLIAACCNKGDIDGATQILQTMKDKQIPINEAVFNSLIIGHSRSNDMESAVGILSVMKQAGLEASGDTYAALLCGYAKHGDVAAIDKTLSDCQTEDVEISDRQLLEVAFTLTINGHSDKLSEVLGHLKGTPEFNEDIKNVGLRLISRGHASAAVMLLKSMRKNGTDEVHQMEQGNFLIKQAIKMNWPKNKLLLLCEEMKSSGCNAFSLHAAAEASMIKGDLELSLNLLTELAAQDSVLHHYFWPILVQYGKQKNFKGVVNTLKQMQELVGQPISGETLKDYVMPHLNETHFDKLKQAGIPLATSASAMVGYLLGKGQIEAAAKIGLRHRSNYNSVTNRRLLVQACKADSDVPSLVKLVQVMSEGEGDDSNVAGLILLGVLRKSSNLAGPLLTEYLDAGIGLTPEHAESVKEVLGQSATDEIVAILNKLSSGDFKKAASINWPQSRRTYLEKDETSILNTIAAVEAKGESTIGLKRQLLMHYCHNRDLEKAVALKETLEGDLDFQPGLMILFMDLYCHHGQLDKALEFYKQAMAKDGSHLDAGRVVRLVTLMCKSGKVEDALQILNAHPQQPGESDAEPDSRNGHLSLSWKLLNSLAEIGNVENLNKVFDTLVSNNYIEPTNVLLGPLIKVHLLKDDVESALKQFEDCCIKYRATPWKNELSCKLIQKEDAAALQKVADLSTQIHGEVNSLYDLVLAFVECKKNKQARKILETPGLRTKTQRISAACQRYYNSGQIENLTTVLDVTKGYNHINRAEIYQYLLSAYSKVDDVDKAFALWTEMQEEDTKPTDQFLKELGKLLSVHNRPVPFDVPTTQHSSSSGWLRAELKAPTSPKIKLYRQALHVKDLDEALRLKKELNDADLSKSDLSRLVSLLVNNGRVGEASKMLISWFERGLRPDVSALSYVVNSIAKIGDVDALKTIGTHLNQDLQRMVSYSNRFTHCMVEAGRAAEMIELLKKNMENATTPEEIARVAEAFPKGGIFSVFETAPELIPQVEEMAEVYKQKGNLDPINMLWSHYTIVGETEKADKAWAQLKPSERIMFLPIIKQARITLDLNMVETLLAKCRAAGVQSSAIGLLYTSIIDILLSQDKVGDCERRLEEALKVCALEDIGRGVLMKLKTNLELSGKEFPYIIPLKKSNTNRSQINDSSSSSSDSEDDETQKKSQQRI